MSETNKAVFLSYASQDAEAARRICDALRAAGVEVWFDQSELRGGDAWDQKIRRQIKECALFVPIISANTEARLEGYFRLEWRQADQRTHLMGKSKTFLLPVCIDDTSDHDADVPDSFVAVQWIRLPGGEPTPAMVGQVKALLAAPVAPVVGRRSPATDATPIGQLTPGPRRRALPWIIAGLAVAVLALVAIVRPWTRDSRRDGATRSSMPQNEVQVLVAKAREILENGDELNRESFSLAEDLLKRAVTLDPANGAAWAASADLSYGLRWHGLDLSDDRRELMRRQAERARSLAPELPEALVVSADVRAELHQDLPGIEQELLGLAARLPGNWRVHRALGMTYRFLGRTDDSIHALVRAHQISNGNPRAAADLVSVLTRQSRYAEAEPVVAGAVKKRPIGRLLVWDQIVRIYWRGDLAGAQAALASWPAWLLMEDRGAFHAWRTWLWGKQPEKALAVIQRLPRDYLRDHYFTGPCAVLTARAHEAAGHAEAARADWQTAVRICDRVLTAIPQNPHALYWKAWALARLGDLAAAQAICTQMEQRNLIVPTAGSEWSPTNDAPALWATVSRPELALLELAKPRSSGDERFAITRAMLELDPSYDSLRGDPRFLQAIEAALAPPNTVPVAGVTDTKSVAVLAFENLSDDKSNEYFSDGISEELLNVLAKVPGLRVAARPSAFYFKGKNATAQEIGQKLGVAHIVEGSVRRDGVNVRVVARLSRAETGEQLWSDKFEGESKNIFALQDEIAGRIAENLKLKLGGSPRVAKPVNPEAHRLYLEGRHFWSQRSEEGFARAETALQKAVEIDPQFARAHAALADLWTIRGLFQREGGEAGTAELGSRAHTAARRALEFDPDLVEVHATFGELHYIAGRAKDAEEAINRCLARAPNYATARNWHGDVMLLQGRLDLALDSYTAAARLDPLSPVMLWDCAKTLLWARRPAEALDYTERARALSGDSVTANVQRARALLDLGRNAEAVAAIRLVEAKLETDYISRSRIWGAIHVLRVAEGDSAAAPLAERALRQLPPGSFARANIFTSVGRLDDALPFLEDLPPSLVSNLYWDTRYDSLRDNPRFHELIGKLGRTAEYKVARETLARMQEAVGGQGTGRPKSVR